MLTFCLKQLGQNSHGASLCCGFLFWLWGGGGVDTAASNCQLTFDVLGLIFQAGIDSKTKQNKTKLLLCRGRAQRSNSLKLSAERAQWPDGLWNRQLLVHTGSRFFFYKKDFFAFLQKSFAVLLEKMLNVEFRGKHKCYALHSWSLWHILVLGKIITHLKIATKTIFSNTFPV